MKRTLIVLTFLICSTAPQAFAQETKQTEAKPAATETDKPKNEVDQLLDTAKEHGELVLVRCLQHCGEEPIVAGVETGRALELPKPAYPQIARMAHASGQVTVRLLIAKDGTVMAAAAISGHPLLYGVSVEAAKNSRFSPTKVDGEPVKVTGVIIYNFVAQ
jgi:TonB family protein